MIRASNSRMQFHPIRLLLGVMLALSFPQAALSQLQLRVTAPALIAVSNNLSYTLNLTNESVAAGQVTVSSTFSPSLRFISATSNENVSFTVSGSQANFQLLQFVPSANERLNLTLQPTQVGTTANRVAASVVIFHVGTDVSTTVTDTPGNAEVAVAVTLSPATPPVFVNDWMALSVGLFNRGGGTVSGSLLTNRFTNA